MRWLITGGCGFIGTALCRRLVSEMQHVSVVDNGDMDLPWPDGIEAHDHDVKDESLMAVVMNGVDIVVHLAAQTSVPDSKENPSHDFYTNAEGTFTVLKRAARADVKRVIFASSAAAETCLSPYGASKAAGEAYCKAFHASYGLHTTALRFSNVYGPGSKHKQSVIAQWMKAYVSRETCKIYGDGEQSRDFIYVDDVVDAIIRTATAEYGGYTTYNVSTGIGTSLNQLKEFMPKDAEFEHIDGRTGEQDTSILEPFEFMTDLGWLPMTSLKTGMKQTLDWFNRADKA